MRATHISGEDYLRKGMSKANMPQQDNRQNKLVDHFALLSQHDQLSNLGMEGEDMSQKAM